MISSNIFLALNSVLYTPSLSEGCVEGVMRKQVFHLASKSGMEVQECELDPELLLKADEVFTSNTILGIQWVCAYRGKRYYHTIAGKLVDALNAEMASLSLGLQAN